MLEAELNERFERTDVVYQTLDGIPFEVSILAPRSIVLTSSSPRPLLVHFHGGGFILGTAFDPEITPKWQGTFAKSSVTIHLLTSKRQALPVCREQRRDCGLAVLPLDPGGNRVPDT